MKKFVKNSTLALMLAAAATTAGGLQAGDAAPSFKWYGTLSMAVDVINNGTESETAINDHVNKLGVGGSQMLNDNLKAIYQMEFEVRLADMDNSKDGMFTGRNSFVGLAGDWGAIKLGRQDTPYKPSQGKLDIFGDTIADFAVVMGRTAKGSDLEDRPLDQVVYESPKMGSWNFAAMYSNDAQDTDFVADKSTGVISLNATYNDGGLYAGLGYQSMAKDATNNKGGESLSAMRLGLGYKADFGEIGAMVESIDGSNADSRMSWMINYAKGFGNNKFKVQYATAADSDVANADDGASYFAVGVDHSFAKSTTGYILYSAASLDAKGASKYELGDGSAAKFAADTLEDSVTAISLGMIHKF
ncbi:MAG: porin [Planctomycetes bacterium]|nr:porin [Planctomycetota bacterium]